MLLGCATASAQQSATTAAANVDLSEASRHGLLAQNLGRQICISGVVSNDDLGVYFLLAPREGDDGVIRPYPPRVQVSLKDASMSLQRLRSGRVYRVCGKLTDITPAIACHRDDCKWYEIRDPYLG